MSPNIGAAAMLTLMITLSYVWVKNMLIDYVRLPYSLPLWLSTISYPDRPLPMIFKSAVMVKQILSETSFPFID